MEPRKSEETLQARGASLAAPPRQQERKRHFQIIKLEERIAPSKGGNTRGSHSCFAVCGSGAGCH